MVVARDIAHAKLKERLDAGEGLPQYMKDYCVYYAGPAKTPEGMASGSFGPTTAGRMDSYVAEFQAAGGSMVMLAKGNRSKQVTDACKQYGGFYLGSIGGPAARLAQDCITKVEVLEYPELGMEAIWKIEVQDFPAFIVVDDKGNDFFDLVNKPYVPAGAPVTLRCPPTSQTMLLSFVGSGPIATTALVVVVGQERGQGASSAARSPRRSSPARVWPPRSRNRCSAATVDGCPSVALKSAASASRSASTSFSPRSTARLGGGDGVRREGCDPLSEPVDERPQLVGWQRAVDPSPAPRRSPHRCRRSRG